MVHYAREDFTTSSRRYDLVLDLVGNRSLRDLRRVLKPSGSIVLSGVEACRVRAGSSAR